MQFRTVLPSAFFANVLSRVTPQAALWTATLVLTATGCDDLGKCDETKARTLVINGEGQPLYAGQAVLNSSCAAGQCHASGAKGRTRQGVPKDLDFDLQPAPVVATSDKNGVPSGNLLVNSKVLSTLRRNQRRVFDLRDDIWDQIKDGLMPPDGVGANYLKAAAGADVTIDGATCKRGTEELAPIASSDTKKVVRNWLACGAPVVEVSDPAVRVSVFAEEPAGLAGTVGQQMPFCQNCDAPITFDQLHSFVFASSCVNGCHTPGGIADPSAFDGFDLTNLEVAYASLTKEGALGGSEACNMPGAPLVVPGDPAASYLVAKMGGSAVSSLALCGGLMPLGAQQPLDCGVRQVVKWIEEGAPGPGKAVDDTGSGDSDAGMPKADAGM